MQARKISNNHYIIEDTKRNFSADIKMNPRDAMVFATVTKLPEENQEALLADFDDYLKTQVGGKILLQLPKSVAKEYGEAKDMGSVKFITLENINKARETFNPKQKVLLICDNTEGLEYLSYPEDFEGKFEKLFAFKKANADFVTEQKIKNGLYSATAEEEKARNEFSRHFAFVDKNSGEFIACIQLCTHNDLGYLSDLIVAKTHRNQGYAQTLLKVALTELILIVAHKEQKFPEGAWLIEGAHDAGDPLIPVHHRLYDELLGAKPMTAELQRQLGFRLMFGPAKELLLTASNRDLLPPQESLDGKLSPAQAFAKGLTPMQTISRIGAMPVVAANDESVEVDIEQGLKSGVRQ